jgi:hypothetical protein
MFYLLQVFIFDDDKQFHIPSTSGFHRNYIGTVIDNYLVGALEHEFYEFPYIGNVIIPTDFHIFQRGRSTTNQIINFIGYNEVS